MAQAAINPKPSATFTNQKQLGCLNFLSTNLSMTLISESLWWLLSYMILEAELSPLAQLVVDFCDNIWAGESSSGDPGDLRLLLDMLFLASLKYNCSVGSKKPGLLPECGDIPPYYIIPYKMAEVSEDASSACVHFLALQAYCWRLALVGKGSLIT